MSRALRSLLLTWLDFLAIGVVLSTAFCYGILLYDIRGFATLTEAEGGFLIRATLWAVLALVLAPIASGTERMFRDPDPQ